MSIQISFFQDERSTPQGLHYHADFIPREEEEELIRRISSVPLSPFQFGVFHGKRRVTWFGWRYDYTSHKLEKAEEFPDWITPLVARVESFAQLKPASIQQLLLTEYDVGAGIGWHRDKRHFDKVLGLSLGSACKLRFRLKVKGRWERFALNALPRSLYLMTGEARGVWEHSIPPVEARRYSITFRTMSMTG